jgi:predicted HTH domain antitoxin
MSSPPASSRPKLKRRTLCVDLPEVVVELLAPTPEEVAMRLAVLAMMEMFRRGEVSSGWAAEQLGISKWDFLDLLFDHDVPYFDLSAEELREQVRVAMPRPDRSTS